MRYNSDLETFVDGVDFTREDSCIWVVYPPGAAGDLIASVVNFHYARTAAGFRGITESGRVIFRTTDEKVVNLNFIKNNLIELNQNFINLVNKQIGNKHLNYSLLDAVIFANHAWRDESVCSILDFFPAAKVIRILPKNNLEKQIIQWLAQYKNQNVLLDLPNLESSEPIALSNLKDPRLLDVYFGDIFKLETFEELYNHIIRHLDLPYKLIRYDFINYWFTQQPSQIKTTLQSLQTGN